MRSTQPGNTSQPPLSPVSMVCLDLSALNLTELVDFDVNTLAKEPKPHVDELADFVGEMQEERGNNKEDI